MSVLDQKTILPEFIKLRWQEPYVTSGLNRKTFKTIPRGVYNGFVVKAGPALGQIQVVHDDPAGWGLTGDYQGGDFDQASGWSIAVHAASTGFTTNVMIQAGPGRNYVFDVGGYASQTIFPVLDVTYVQGTATTAQVKLVQAADLDVNPDLLVLARVDVPPSGIVDDSNIVYDDALYPRVTPFANRFKYGYMAPSEIERIDFLESVSGSPAFVHEVVATMDGPQTIALPTGFSYVVGADDLWVHKNGIHATKGASRDYVEVDRGDGNGEEIQWVGIIRSGDRVKFRIQKYAAVASSTLSVYDERALIGAQVLNLNFSGSGVSVLPDGPNSVTVRVGGGGGGGGTVKSCLNSFGSEIPAGRAVSRRSNNTVSPCDPVAGDRLYGLTSQNVPPGVFGDIALGGIVADLASVSGFTIGSDLFVSHLGDGSLTDVAPDPTAGDVIRVGMADGADGVSGGVATDIVFDRGRLT